MKHVVVVEDDAHNAVLFRRILEKRAGCRVTQTEDPAEVLELVKGGDVALVVMDVSLRHVPILLCTAHAMRGDAERLLKQSGADDYVSKPITDHERFAALAMQMMERAA